VTITLGIGPHSSYFLIIRNGYDVTQK